MALLHMFLLNFILLLIVVPNYAMYNGCFQHSDNLPAIGSLDQAWIVPSNTPFTCIKLCANETPNYKYAGVAVGNECWCGHSFDIGKKLSDAECMVTRCPGDNVRFCGANSTMAVYDVENVCPYPDRFKDDCSGICRCKNDNQCNPSTGDCNGGECDYGYKGTNCQTFDPSHDICTNIATPLTANMYIGCFNHMHSNMHPVEANALQGGTSSYWILSKNTPAMCLSHCKSQQISFNYAGVTNGSECWCGLVYNVDRAPETRCRVNRCPGSFSLYCGARTAMAVYRTGTVSYNCANVGCPSARYVVGTNCSGTCHCADNNQCDWRTGRCAGPCAPGYAGDKCHINGCPRGRFVSNNACSGTCRCQLSSQCDWKTGDCSGPCKDGWMGNKCQTEGCPFGRFKHTSGGNCPGVCRCADNSQCNWRDGTCNGACEDGWLGDYCQTEGCPTGRFKHTSGGGCPGVCRCADNSQCNWRDGMCNGPCEDGWLGDNCQTEGCPIGRFKHTSGGGCPGVCRCADNSQCNWMNGTCNGPCEDGWLGDKCQIEGCPLGSFKHTTGGSCSGVCHCAHVSQCDWNTGGCEGGVCEDGYAGQTCQLEDCPLGKYVVLNGCTGVCHCKNNTQCDWTTGGCGEGGCANGFQGDQCQIVFSSQSKMIAAKLLITAAASIHWGLFYDD